MQNGGDTHFRFFLGLFIKQKRESLKLSSKEAANRLQITTQNYTRLENGRLKMNDKLLDDLQTHFELGETDLTEIQKIATVARLNQVLEAVEPNYPK